MINNYQNISKVARMVFLAVLFLAVTFVPQHVSAQVVQAESFEGTIFPPPGFNQAKDPAATIAAFSRQNGAGSNPTASPFLGSAMMMFNSFSAPSGEISYLISKPFDFSNGGAPLAPTFSLRVFRDGGLTGFNDKIEVYSNTSPTITGATLLTNSDGVTAVFRPNTSFPTVAANSWYLSSYTMPLIANPKKTYIIIKGTSADGNNIFMDDFRVNTYPSAAFTGDVTMDLVQQNLASVGQNTQNQWIVGVRCILGGTSGCGVAGINAVKLDSLLFNTNGTSSLSDIQNAKVWYTGGSNQFSTGYVSPFPTGAGETYTTNSTVLGNGRFGQIIPVPATNLDFLSGANCFVLEYDTSYFWLSYDIKPAAVGGNLVDGDFRGAAVSQSGTGCPTSLGSSTAITPGTSVLSGGPQIDLAYCVPTYTTGTAWAGYTNNDYVQSVQLFGGVAGSFINTAVNAVAVQSPAASCYPGCKFAGHPPDYELRPNATGSSIIFTQGNSYTITVQAGTWFSSNFIQVWVDWNHDGDFYDAGEQIASTPLPNLSSNAFANYTINVPTLPYTGSTRMRVREVFSNSSIDPCLQYTFGEVEDFNVTILPNCPPAYCLWLGNTSDWNNTANWCGGIPTLATDAVVDKGNPAVNAASKTYYVPYIKSGVAATTKALTIAATDSLFIDAPNPATTSLKMSGDLNLNGRTYVNGGYNDSITIATGTLVNLITPFKGLSSAARYLVIYTATELATFGLAAGDQITAIGFSVAAKGSTGAYQNFNVSYVNSAAVPTQFATNNPAIPAMTTIYSSPGFTTVAGWNKIPLGTTVTWDGVNNVMMQICFDNPSSVGGDDKVNVTQTTGRASTLLLTRVSGATSGCALTYSPPSVGDNFWSGNKTNRPNMTFITNRPYGKPVLTIQGQWNNNGQAIGTLKGFSAGNSKVVFDSTVSQNIQGTQNTIFHELEINKADTTRLVTMVNPVVVADTLWMSKGQLVMNKKTLTLYNTSKGAITRTAGFLISEDSLSKVNWYLGTPADNQARLIPFATSTVGTVPSANSYIPYSFTPAATNTGVIDTLTVSTYKTTAANTPFPPGVSHLNKGFRAQVIGGATTTITAGSNVITNASIVGILPGDIITCTTNGIIPYGTLVVSAVGTTITMSANALAPLSGTNVILWFNTVGVYTDDSPNTADRFWIVSKSNTSAIPASPTPSPYNVGMTFNFMINEKPATGWTIGAAPRPQPWRTYTSSGLQMGGWQRLLNNNAGAVYSFTPPVIASVPVSGTISMAVTNYDFQYGASSPWTISTNTTPLPIELVDFKAEPVGCKVRLAWVTASEKDNDYFTIERSPVTSNEFEYVTKVNSYYQNSSFPLTYEAWDNTPLKGMQWYRLKQTDLNSNYSYSEPVLVTFNCEGTVAMPFDILNVYNDQLTTGLTQVEFAYNSDKPVVYTIMDATGRLVATGKVDSAQPGVNRVGINQSLPRGMYIISLQNDEKRVSRKFVF